MIVDKHKAYDYFLKSLRIAIANTSVYFEGHPFFRKSIDDLRLKINDLFPIINPLKIGIAPNYLFIGDVRLENEKLYQDIAEFFHRRKVKNIEIREGVSIDELITFLTQINLSPKDIIRAGGLQDILKKKNISNILIQDLDYSQLLGEEGEEYKDVWLHLLRKGFEQGDAARINQLADNFVKELGKFDIKGLLGDKEIESIINKLLIYLKYKDKDRFFGCIKGLMGSVIKSKYLPKEDQAGRLKAFFNELSADDLADILLEQLQDKRAIDSLSFKLFSQLINVEKHQELASSLAHKLEKVERLKSNPQMVKKIKELFLLPDTPYVSKIYRQNLSPLLESIVLGEGMSFDRSALKDNYRLILLELFVFEFDRERLKLILDKIFTELQQALVNNDLEYIKKIIGALDRKRKEFPFLEPVFKDADMQISGFIEEAILSQDIPFDFEYLTNIIKTSSLDSSIYLDKIFNTAKINPYILKLFFKFFFKESALFYERLNKNISNIMFIKNLIKSLKELEPAQSLEILKFIFPLANDFIKLEILKNMRDLSLCDEEFLFPILKKRDFAQRKCALAILEKNSRARKKAARLLLAIPNPLGLKNRVIEENLRLINEVPFSEAKEYLSALTQYKYFWNKAIREKAKKIMNRL